MHYESCVYEPPGVQPERLDLVTPAIEGDGDAYNSAAARLLATASTWAYSDGRTLSSILWRCGLEDVVCHVISVSNSAILVDTQAYFVRGVSRRLRDRPEPRSVGILVFRGTQFGTADFVDVLTDITVETIEWPPHSGAMVHEGFHRALQCVWPKALEVLLANPVDHLFVAGHSLGGALAVLAAASIASKAPGAGPKPETAGAPPGAAEREHPVATALPQLRSLYTYGQPMVGDRNFASLCEGTLGAKTFRHVYQRDWVPHLPPLSTGRFCHFGSEYHGTKVDPWSRRSRPVSQAFTIMLSLPIAVMAFVANKFPVGRAFSFGFAFSIDDHIPQHYVDCSKLENPSDTFP